MDIMLKWLFFRYFIITIVILWVKLNNFSLDLNPWTRPSTTSNINYKSSRAAKRFHNCTVRNCHNRNVRTYNRCLTISVHKIFFLDCLFFTSARSLDVDRWAPPVTERRDMIFPWQVDHHITSDKPKLKKKTAIIRRKKYTRRSYVFGERLRAGREQRYLSMGAISHHIFGPADTCTISSGI